MSEVISETARLINAELAEAIFEKNADALVLVDGDTGKIMQVNDRCSLLFGYHKSELADQIVEILVPDALRDQHKKHRANFAEDPRSRSMGLGLKLEGRRKNGTTFPAEITLAPLQTKMGMFVIVSIRRKEASI
jgi:PAS domain S-box-containing protein